MRNATLQADNSHVALLEHATLYATPRIARSIRRRAGGLPRKCTDNSTKVPVRGNGRSLPSRWCAMMQWSTCVSRALGCVLAHAHGRETMLSQGCVCARRIR
ncbi:hypothetical protein PUN28_007587 [Cardiocondyla obscurior]|uniref:Uncharacterized protein n=1 Tax=Cardiocondyla obscurior TaxID=286306 RepID=A0AAW2G9Z0_9HYME